MHDGAPLHRLIPTAESVDLNLIRALDALLHECHVSRAAERLELSQAATSHALARLRKTFDDPLLIRSGRELVPTPEADRLKPIAAEIMRLVGDALQAPHFDPITARSTFTLVSPDFLAAEILPTITVLLQQQAPDVRIENYSSPPPHEINLGGKIDAALLPAERVPKSRDSIHAANIRWHGLAGAKNPVAGTSPDLEEFCSLPHIVVDRALMHEHLDDLLGSRGMTRNIAMRLTNSELIPHLLATTNLVTITPMTTPVGPELASFTPPVDIPALEYRICWSRRLALDPASIWFRERIAEVCADKLRDDDGPADAETADRAG